MLETTTQLFTNKNLSFSPSATYGLNLFPTCASLVSIFE